MTLEKCDMELSMLIEDMQRRYESGFDAPTEADIQEVLNRAEGNLKQYISNTEVEAQKFVQNLSVKGK